MNKWVVVGVVICIGISWGTACAGGLRSLPAKGSINPPIVLKGVYGEKACFRIDNRSRFVKAGKELYPGISIEKISEGGSRVILSTPEGRKVLKIGESVYPKVISKEGPEALSTSKKGKQREYKIEKNDTLWLIAEKVYGDGNKWKKIYNYNKDKIKYPNMLRPGLIIVIPE